MLLQIGVRMFSVADFCNKELETEPYIIKPELLPVRGKLYIAAPEKHNKSFALLSMGFALASAQPLWSVPDFTIARRFRVGYFDQELGSIRLQKRLRSIRNLKPADEIRDTSFFVEPRNRAFRLDKKEGLLAIEALALEHGLEVLLFDPISKFYPGFDENNTQQMSQLVLALDTLIDRTGTSLVFAHHMPKPSEVARHGAQRMRGSTVLAADLDTYIEFKRLSPGHHKSQYIEASFTTRDAPVEPVYLKRLPSGEFDFAGRDNPLSRRFHPHTTPDYEV